MKFLLTLAGYTLTSYYFLKNPILHAKKPLNSIIFEELLNTKRKMVLNAAHRGGSAERIENTIEAFDNAVKNGSHLLEMDLNITKDGVVVVSHDNHLGRLCGKNLTIDSLNYNELPNFAHQIPLDFTLSRFFDTTQYPNSKFPTLEEVFKRYPNTLMMLDIKHATVDLTQKVHKLIKQYNREDKTIWGSIGDDTNLKAADDTIPRFLNGVGCAKLFLYYITGLLPYIKIDANVVSLPYYTKEYEDWSRSIGKPNVGLRFSFLKFATSVYGPLFKHLQDRGLLVIIWTLNHEKDFEDIIKLDVNGIITDNPTRLNAFLEKAQRQYK